MNDDAGVWTDRGIVRLCDQCVIALRIHLQNWRILCIDAICLNRSKEGSQQPKDQGTRHVSYDEEDEK